MTRFRLQMLLAFATIILVIVLAGVTALLALRETATQRLQAHEIDARLVSDQRLADSARELAASARRYMTSGDGKELQRVHAIIDQLDHDNTRQPTRMDPKVEASLDAYELGILSATSTLEQDPIERLNRFEDDLARVRGPLFASVDEVIALERSRREALRSADGLARGAQWTVLLACLVGVMLAIGVCIVVLRRVPSVATNRPPTADASPLVKEPFDIGEVIAQAIATRHVTLGPLGGRVRFERLVGMTVFADRERVRSVLDTILSTPPAEGAADHDLSVLVSRGDGGVRVAVVEPAREADPCLVDPNALLLCRQIIEAHGGRLGIQSSIARRTYWFTLPGEPVVLR